MLNTDLEQSVKKSEALSFSIQIRDQATFEEASAFLLSVKGIKKEVDSTFDPIIEKAHSAHKEALAQKKKFSTSSYHYLCSLWFNAS